MRIKSVLPLLSVAAALHAGAAHANLITNGSFETTTNGTNKQLTQTSLVGWGSTNGSDAGYNFVLNGASNSGLTLKETGNGFTLSPDGGNFFASDPVYYPGVLYQLLTGLTVGTSYTLTFDYALAQQTGFSGTNTNDYWQVGLGTSYQDSTFQTTTPLSIASGGFSGWQTASMTFTATGVNEVLTFLAKAGSTGAPPFMLLDGVSMDAVTTGAAGTVSEPATLSMLLGGLGLLGLAARRRRNKQG